MLRINRCTVYQGNLISIENKLSSDRNLLKSANSRSLNHFGRGFLHIGPGLDVKT